ncbi:MAG: response regulator [Alphaproteobacteria bacterium]
MLDRRVSGSSREKGPLAFGIADRDENDRPRASAQGDPDRKTLQPLRVLVVEDEFLAAITTADMLRDAGYDVIGPARSAAEARRLVQQHEPDVALMDIQLAGAADGVDAAIDLFRTFGVRSIFVTAHSDRLTRERAAAARPLSWVAKPYSDDQLLRALRLAADELG